MEVPAGGEALRRQVMLVGQVVLPNSDIHVVIDRDCGNAAVYPFSPKHAPTSARRSSESISVFFLTLHGCEHHDVCKESGQPSVVERLLTVP